MQDLGLKSFDKLYPMLIHKYKDLIVDQNATEKDKINQIIVKLNALGKLSNDVVRDWNTVYQWVMNDGLTQDVDNKLEEMRANGEISQLLQNIFNSLTGDMTTLHTTAKDTLVNSINEVDDLAKSNQTQLAQSMTFVYIDQFPRQGSETDDSARIQRAHDSIVNSGVKGVLQFKAGTTYKLNSGLNINLSFVRLKGEGTLFDASGMTSGTAITFVGTINPPYKQATQVIDGIELFGNGKSGTVAGMKLDNTGTTAGASHIKFEHVVIHDFQTGIYFGSNAYCVKFNGDIYQCGTCISSPNGVSNSGERITFIDCTLFNSDLILNNGSGGSDFHFIGCSMDYCTKFMTLTAGKTFLRNCHIEFTDTTSDRMFTTDGGNTILSLSQCQIGTYGTPTGTYETFYSNNSNDYISIVDCAVFNLPTDRVIGGIGFKRVENIYGNANTKGFLVADSLSYLPDPTFEGANALAQLVTSVSGTGSITVDATTSAGTGAKSIKFSKTTAGDTCQAYIDIPIYPGQKVLAEFKTKYNVTQGTNNYESFLTRYAFYDAFGNQINNMENYFSGNQATFTKQKMTYGQNATPPIGAVKVRLFFSIYMGGTGTAWLDDLYINIV